jgi:hypothetical protein
VGEELSNMHMGKPSSTLEDLQDWINMIYSLRPKKNDILGFKICPKKNDVLLNLACVHVHVGMQQSVST